MTDDELRANMAELFCQSPNNLFKLTGSAVIALLDRVRDRDALAAEVERLKTKGTGCKKCEGCGKPECTDFKFIRLMNGCLNLCPQCLAEFNGKNPELKQLRADRTRLVIEVDCKERDNAALRERLAKVAEALREYDPNDPQGFLYISAAVLKEVAL